MIAISNGSYVLYNFLILMVKNNHHSFFDSMPTFAMAKLVADKEATNGFSCVVFDLEQRATAYENNPWMIKSNLSYKDLTAPTPLFASTNDYLKFERRNLENGVRLMVESQPSSINQLNSLLVKATADGNYFPRSSGQTPEDAIKDYTKS